MFSATPCAAMDTGATLLVTSAREGLDAAALRAQPLAGATFVLRPGVRGLAACRFGAAAA